MSTQEIIVAPSAELAERVTGTISELRALRTFIAQELANDVDYGVIPGTQKPTLYLAGAQKTNMYFNVRPDFIMERIELPNGHAEFSFTCNLVHRSSGTVVGQGVGSCSTMEGKYRYRSSDRKCPKCGAAAIMKGKIEYAPKTPDYKDGGWLCFKKKSGCGAQFPDKDKSILDQPAGKVENENIYDCRNTCLKIGKKRALVDASIGLGCMSEFFTQDLEDMDVYSAVDMTPPPKSEPPVSREPVEIGRKRTDLTATAPTGAPTVETSTVASDSKKGAASPAAKPPVSSAPYTATQVLATPPPDIIAELQERNRAENGIPAEEDTDQATARAVNFARVFEDALPARRKKEAKALRHAWLAEHHYFNSKGEATAKAIPYADFFVARDSAAAWARLQK